MTKPLAQSLLIVLLFWSRSANAQQCRTLIDTTGINDLNVVINPCRDAQTWLHFVSARGGYANALSFYLQNPAGDHQVPSTCALQPQGLSGPTPDCLKYTGECSRTQNPVLGCFPDAQTQRNEITCSCQPSPSFGPLNWNAKDTFSVSPWFMVDTDLDGKTDNSFWGASSLTTKRMLSWIQWWDSAVTMNWEDNWQVRESDFNDYVATIEVKTCGPERFPPQSERIQQVTCIDPCGDNPCVEQQLQAATERVRFNAGITVDDIKSETPYEANGRRVQLTLFGYDDFDQQLLKANPRTVAICPVVNLEWMDARNPASTTDLTTLMRYGDPACTTNPSDLSGSPICNGEVFTPMMSLAFSTLQTVKPNCGASGVGGDIVTTRPSDACAANSLIRHYELSLAAIDRTLNDPALHLNTRTAAEIMAKLDSVDVYVISEIKTPDFVCPSGPNVMLESVSANVGKVMRYHLTTKADEVRVDRFHR